MKNRELFHSFGQTGKRLLALGLSFVLATSLVACGGDKEQPKEVDKSVYMDASQDVETRIEALLEQMTTEEKVGQLIQAEQAHISADEVKEYHIGSVLSGGGSAPSTGNSVENWNERLTELKVAATETRLAIPLLYGIDAVHGNNNISGATIFPHNIGLGAANDPELMYRIGEATASEVRASGAQWTFAPCIGNPQDVRWGRSYEGFSEKTDDIGPLVENYVKGFQDNDIIACAKHFIGEGYTQDGVNQGDVKMSVEEFNALLQSGVLDPYEYAVNANVYTVMASYNSVNGLKCHENHHLLTEVLKGQLGFKYLVVGDYNAVAQVSGNSFGEQIANCVNAGVDLLMEPDNWKNAYKELLKDVEDGTITEERLDDAVARNLRVKFVAGLFEEEFGEAAELEDISNFGSAEHREVAREAVRKSLVLLKNNQVGDATAINALANAANITVAGQKAFDLGSQCGGWTVTWQGMSGNKTIKGGTSIIQGLAEELGENGKISHTVDGTVKEGSDAVIVVFGETPYAETDGDRKEAIPMISSGDREMLEALRPNVSALGEDVPVIAVVVAGRPLDLRAYDDMFDAVVMAWLPGSEGQGVADVLLGEYDFSGTTKFTWPEQYEYGTGLNKAGEQL